MLNRGGVAPNRALRDLDARGFTLIELAVALGVAAVLAALTLPSFERHLQRARRADALIAVLGVQAAQERFRGGAPSYGSLAEIGADARSADGHYRLEVGASDADGYELLATATGIQARDTRCRVLKLVATGAQVEQRSGSDRRATNDPAQNRRCWELR